MNLNDMLNLDVDKLMKLSRSDLSKIVTKISSAANKRLKRLEEQEIKNPVYLGIQRSGGKFSVKGKNLNSLRAEYTRVSAFMRNNTSTLKGAKEQYKKFQARFGSPLSPRQMNDLYSTYRKLEELEPAFLKTKYGSENMMTFLHDKIVSKKGNPDEILQSALDEIKRNYEVHANDGEIDMGEFFEI